MSLRARRRSGRPAVASSLPWNPKHHRCKGGRVRSRLWGCPCHDAPEASTPPELPTLEPPKKLASEFSTSRYRPGRGQSLELASLSLYILTAFNKRNARSSEAALKYFLFGGMSAAFLLFGFSLLYGLAGSTNLPQIAAALAGRGLDPLLLVAIVTTVIGFGFKVAAVPFHLWAPDAYEGAPTPSAAFIASGSKVASFYILAKIMTLGFVGVAGSAVWQGYVSGWTPVIAVMAALSMVLGNLTAIVQSSVKRLLAYSAIAHAGYMLLGVLANTPSSHSALLFYVITYALTVLGAFGVVTVVEEATGGDALVNFAGLSRRAPGLSLCLLVFMLSLARHSAAGGVHRKIFPVQRGGGRGRRTSRPALAGDSGHRDERRVVLLLPAGAETGLGAGCR